MIHFLDTSALAKAYLPEAGAADVRRILRSSDVAAARIAYAELVAAVARAHRDGSIDATERDRVFARAKHDFPRFRIIEVRARLLAKVPSLVVRHPLRGYDAVQLASALDLRRSGAAVTFWSTDGRFADAAEKEGLRSAAPS